MSLTTDRVFTALLAVVLALSYLHYIRIYPRLYERYINDEKYPTFYQILIYGSLAALVYLILQTLTCKICQPLAEKLLPKDRWSQMIWKLKCTRFGTLVWKSTYFICVVLLCILSICKESWWPLHLGGIGPTKDLWTGYPYQENVPAVYIYFYLSFGHHLASSISLLRHIWLPDFFDLFLPCVLALCLVMSAFVSNLLRVGCVILFCHDFCDIFTSLCKALVDTKYKCSTVFLFLCLVVSWFILRLYAFPAAALFPIFDEIRHQDEIAVNEDSNYFLFILLTIAFFNIYWFALMLKMFFNYAQSGQMRDLHSRLEDNNNNNSIKSKRRHIKAS